MLLWCATKLIVWSGCRKGRCFRMHHIVMTSSKHLAQSSRS